MFRTGSPRIPIKTAQEVIALPEVQEAAAEVVVEEDALVVVPVVEAEVVPVVEAAADVRQTRGRPTI
jgi:hypothetical protein